MGTKHKHLYERIIDMRNLRDAYARAAKGKRDSVDYLRFKEQAEPNLAQLQRELAVGTWRPLPPRSFVIFEPKRRQITAPRFADRVVQQALSAVIEPVFDATFLPTVFACRKGLGTHAGVLWVQSQLRKHEYKYFLHTDFAAYFASIDRSVLHQLIRRKVSCRRTLRLIEAIIPPTGHGVPIGALTSQLAANIYAGPLDYHLHHQLRVPFARYMDDVVVLGDDLVQLREVQAEIERFANDVLGLRLSHWHASPVARGVNFLGYRIWPSHKLLRKSSVRRAKRAIAHLAAVGDTDSLRQFLSSWRGHAACADSHNLHAWLQARYPLPESHRPRAAVREPSLLATLSG